jgi:pyridinium-3,5-biscarboxylic acid mononucleotide synthase
MNQQNLKDLLEQVRSGAVDVEAAQARLRHLPFEDLGFAKVDHHRAIRHGMPEVIFGQGKAPEHVVEIMRSLAQRSPNVLATRVEPATAALLLQEFPEAEHHAMARAVRLYRDRQPLGKGKIAIVCAGTSDLPVAEEARFTATTMGNEIISLSDVGVAGVHRLLAHSEVLMSARVVICCAGMEGALPSAVGGIVGCPVIAVPTSVGYGAHFHGLGALLPMLNSCASNVTVVNIDNGFGAAYVATLINRI